MARRLLLSYLLLIAITVALFAFVIQSITTQTFSRYLSYQSAAHNEMFPVMLAGHYATNNSWEGVQSEIDHSSLMVGAPLILADADGRIVAASDRSLVGRQADPKAAISAIPVAGSKGATIGVIYTERSQAQKRADETFLTNVTRALLAAGVVVALLAAGLGVLLSRSISRPLAEMSRAARQIARGDYNARVSSRGQDEITDLALAFNQMAEGVGSVERLRRELVGNVSHDLRTPLTVIRGYLEGLRSGQIADRRSAEMAFDAMHTETTRLLRLVDDLRQVAALDGGSLPLNRRPIVAGNLMQEAADRIAPLANAKGVTLNIEITPNLPPLTLDAERMGQAIFNLIENAVRHTPAGGSITLYAGRNATMYCLTVKDTGEGIAPEHLSHVFERFYRADPARSRTEGGAGLGLSIVRAIVEAHNGTVAVKSKGIPGQGSVFSITLPFH